MNQEKYTKSQIKIKSHDISTEAAETETERNASILMYKLCEEGLNQNSEMREHFLEEHMTDLNVSKILEDCGYAFCMDINANKCSKYCYFYKKPD
jgi:hypothetical protein